jgi:hypothetical protein
VAPTKSPTTVRRYRGKIRRINAKLGKVKLGRLTAQLDRTYREWLDEGLHPTSVHHIHAVIFAGAGRPDLLLALTEEGIDMRADATDRTQVTPKPVSPKHPSGRAQAGPSTSQLPGRSALSPELVRSLQRTAGNRAVTRSLTPPGSPPPKARDGAPSPTPVQRFPATALSAPVNWAEKTGSVFRPGEGVSGGVYILTSKERDAAIKKVVVKPVYGATGLGQKEAAEQLQFGDRALSSLLGISTPTTKVVQGGSAEFSGLLGVIRPHQPPKKPVQEGMEPEAYHDVANAKQLVVMSEVPSARSIGSSADKAMTDKSVRADLFGTLFAPAFIEDLARISVGDLLLGNVDRLVMATNLGNVMVSSQGGKRSVYAIDTTPYLGKVSPSAIVSGGGNALRNMTDTKDVADNPAKVIHDFFDTVISRMKAAAPPNKKGVAPPWKLFEDTYQQRRGQIETDFMLGWDSALIDVFALVESKAGRKKMKDLTSEYQGTEGASELSYTTLKAHAKYLGGKAQGMTHQEAAADPAVYVAYRELQNVNAAGLMPNDRFNPYAAGAFPSAAKTADLPSIPSLPNPKVMGNVVMNQSVNEDKLKEIGAKVDVAKTELAQLGTKRRGGFLGVGKSETPRNRVLAGEFIANSYLVGAGAARLPAYMLNLKQVAELFKFTLGKLQASQIARISTVANSLPAAKFAIEESASQFQASIPAIATSIRLIENYADRGPLADKLEAIKTLLEKDIARYGKMVSLKEAMTVAHAQNLLAAKG